MLGGLSPRRRGRESWSEMRSCGWVTVSLEHLSVLSERRKRRRRRMGILDDFYETVLLAEAHT